MEADSEPIVGLNNIEDEFLAIPSIKLNLKYLRSLNLSSSLITKLPEFIGKSKHLRHLNLSYCRKLISFPESIKSLVMLQTLNLNECSQLVFDVEVITKLISLRCLYINGCKAFEEKIPAGLKKLSSLQCLSNFVVEDYATNNSAKLNELRDLNLRGDLCITRLNALSESHEAILKEKKHIRSLYLTWVIDFEGVGSLQLLENLRPHVSLRKLYVSGYPGVIFSSWLSSLTNIVEIKLFRCFNCQHIPPLEKLPSLEKLEIDDMKELKSILYEEISNVFFPSLKTLVIEDCRNLRGWQRLGDDIHGNDMHDNLFLPPFPTLHWLSIYGCPNLTCMPTFPHLTELLYLYQCSMKPMIETSLVQLEDSSFCPLSALECLRIGDVTEAEATPKEWMQKLTSLQLLEIRDSTQLQLLQYINSELEHLIISRVDVDEFELWKNEGDDATQCHGPPPALRSLQVFKFNACRNMKALPEQIGNLKSLRHIELIDCPKLESLPEAIHCLTSIQSLHIQSCPLLRDRCQVETGQDWSKIAHIPKKFIL